MSQPARIYLDNAATSWPKPEAVYQAVDRYQRCLGAPGGRSAYEEAVQVGVAIDQTRQSIARLIGVQDARQVVFTHNGTDSLNQALHGLLRPGDHVVTSVVEHNSVLRPLRNLQEREQITITRVGASAVGIVDPDDIRAAIVPETRLIALVQASNVTGALQPIAEVAAIARQREVLLLVDAAQSLGHLPLDVGELGIDLLAAPGHKGLLGPLGTGVLYIRPGVEQHLDSTRQGGTGSRSEDDRQPDFLPDKYESGNLNAMGIVGLGAGVEFLLDRGLPAVRQHELQLCSHLYESLRDMAGVEVFGPADAQQRCGVVSIRIEGYDPQEVAAMLDAAYRVQVRSGIHCAPMMHASLGTLDRGGTVRFSTGVLSTMEEIETALAAVREIAQSRVEV